MPPLDQENANRVSHRLSVVGMAIGLGLGLVTLLCLMLSAGDPAWARPLAASSPALSAVAPVQAYNDVSTVITLTGSGFLATPAVYLNNAQLSDVGFLSASTLTATVPTDLPGGVYTLTVINPDGPSTSLPHAFTVELSGDGTLGNWQMTSAMNSARDFPGVVATGDYIYALGGGLQATTERAFINPDGTLGAWQALTATMTTARAEAGAVAARGYLYAVGGLSGSQPSASVERSPIQADGTLGAWQVLTATLNVPREGAQVVATDRFIYVIGGDIPGSVMQCVNSVERAAINPDGTLGTWQTLTGALNVSRSYFGAVTVAGNIYVIGGMTCPDGSLRGDVERAVINPDGTLGPWHTMASQLAMPRYYLAGAQAAGNLYAIGGQGITQYLDNLATIEVAAVQPDGGIGAWQTFKSQLNIPRNGPAAVLAHDRLYVVGGYGATDLSSVEQTLVNSPYLFSFDPSVVPATHSTDVTVWGGNLLHASTLRLPDNTLLSTTVDTPSTLTATIPAGLAPGWYTATVTLQNGASATQPYLFKVFVNNQPVFSHWVFLPLAAGPSTAVCGSYFDDFSSDSSGWPIGNDGWVMSDYWNAEYRLLSETAGYIFSYSAPTCRRQNYVVEADARWADAIGDGYGLAFGITPGWQQYYVFYVSSDQQSYGLYRLDADIWTTLVKWTASTAIHASPASNHLKVTRNGTQIKLEANGVVLKTLNDGAGTAVTKAGLFVASYSTAAAADGRFDNFRITALAGASSMQGAAQAEGVAPATHSTAASHHAGIPNNLALPKP